MVVRARIGIKGKDILDRIGQLRAVNPALVKQATLATGATVKIAVEKSAITKNPGPPKYPIRWKSEKQRRAFFATDGFGKGIPYKRIGKLAKKRGSSRSLSRVRSEAANSTYWRNRRVLA